MSLPLCSLIVPTYGRCDRQLPVLNEVLWWCCNQTYPNIEVLVFNDAPDQFLCCCHPKVRVINSTVRYSCLGSKMNAAIEECRGEICFQCDDDDISLPHRVEQAVDALQDTWDFWQPKWWWYHAPKKELGLDGNGYCLTQGAFRRSVFLGKYAVNTSCPDGETIAWAKKNVRFCPVGLSSKKDASYIYRFGISPTHMSGYKDPLTEYRKKKPGRSGCYDLNPVKRQDWSELVKVTIALQSCPRAAIRCPS